MFDKGLKKFFSIEDKGFKKDQKRTQHEQMRIEQYRAEFQ